MSQPADSVWERRAQMLGSWLPYLTLAIATLLSLAQPGQSWTERGEIVGLVVLAAAWVYLLYTRAAEPRREHRVRMALYFAGLLVLASLLMARQPLFFVFAVTGFYHASVLRPWPLTVAGVAATSILINTIVTGFPWLTIEQWSLFVTIIVIQTLAIGVGTVVADKLGELSAQRREAVAELEAALVENARLHA